MHRQIHGSILIISHQERILNIADEILVIADGKLVSRGSKEEVLSALLEGVDDYSGCKIWKDGGVK